MSTTKRACIRGRVIERPGLSATQRNARRTRSAMVPWGEYLCKCEYGCQVLGEYTPGTRRVPAGYLRVHPKPRTEGLILRSAISGILDQSPSLGSKRSADA